MANAYLRARAGAINAAHSYNNIFLFGQMLASLPELIAAERDMARRCAQDPSFDYWLTRAEAARAVTLSHLYNLQRAAPYYALTEFCALLAQMLASDDPELCAAMRARIADDRQAFLLSSSEHLSEPLNQMMSCALDQFDVYFAIENEGCAGQPLTVADTEPNPDQSLCPAA